MAKETPNNTGGSLYNALTANSKIIGTIIADSDIRIDGTVEGDLKCNGKVVIGQQGMMKGSVNCINAEILGTIDGKLTVKETLALRETAHVKGEVRTETLIVEPQAIFNGTCSMGKEPATIKTTPENK